MQVELTLVSRCDLLGQFRASLSEPLPSGPFSGAWSSAFKGLAGTMGRVDASDGHVCRNVSPDPRLRQLQASP